MKKKTIILGMLLSLSFLVACDKEKASDTANISDITSTQQSEMPSEENNETTLGANETTEDFTEAIEETSDTAENVTTPMASVDKGIFNVELTISSDYVDEDINQEKLNAIVKEKGYKSATLNTDGSVTYILTKEQHQELLNTVKESIDKGLEDLINSGNNPTFTSITANDDYTIFSATTTSEELKVSEKMIVLALYTYGGMYGMYSGNMPDNIQVNFINASTGELIITANSKDMKK